MLELQNISYMVDDDDKEILRDINLAFDEKFVAITGKRKWKVHSCKDYRRHLKTNIR